MVGKRGAGGRFAKPAYEMAPVTYLPLFLNPASAWKCSNQYRTFAGVVTYANRRQ
jgi:hypothetical protein